MHVAAESSAAARTPSKAPDAGVKFEPCFSAAGTPGSALLSDSQAP